MTITPGDLMECLTLQYLGLFGIHGLSYVESSGTFEVRITAPADRDLTDLTEELTRRAEPYLVELVRTSGPPIALQAR